MYLSKDMAKEVEGYGRLTKERQDLVCMVLDNLNSGLGLWHRNWMPCVAPISAVTGRSYKGVNNLYLSMIALNRGYKDNRWATFHQIEENGWHFKPTLVDHISMAKGKGVMVEFFEFRDKKTKQPFDEALLDGMSALDKEAYMHANVYPIRKAYRVFNGDLIDGLPERKPIPGEGKNDRVEELLSYWSDNEAKIVYGGDEAFYMKSKDEIHLPPRETFSTYPRLYNTTLHELAHSTAHGSRLDREFYSYGTAEYGQEELTAETASLFLCQEYGVQLTDRDYKNESAYIRNWVQTIKENPDILFKAITDADKIARYVVAKEREHNLSRDTGPEDRLILSAGDAQQAQQAQQTQQAQQAEQAATPAADAAADAVVATDASATENSTPAAAIPAPTQTEGKTEGKAEGKAEGQAEKLAEATAEAIEDSAEAAEKRKPKATGTVSKAPGRAAGSGSRGRRASAHRPYMPPSEVVSEERSVPHKSTDPLVALSDVAVYERAAHTRSGQRFLALYNGRDLMRNIDKSRRFLFSRLAVFTQDEAQLCRIVRTSALYDNSLPESYYKEMAAGAVSDMRRMRKEGVYSSMHPEKPETMHKEGDDKLG